VIWGIRRALVTEILRRFPLGLTDSSLTSTGKETPDSARESEEESAKDHDPRLDRQVHREEPLV